MRCAGATIDVRRAAHAPPTAGDDHAPVRAIRLWPHEFAVEFSAIPGLPEPFERAWLSEDPRDRLGRRIARSLSRTLGKRGRSWRRRQQHETAGAEQYVAQSLRSPRTRNRRLIIHCGFPKSRSTVCLGIGPHAAGERSSRANVLPAGSKARLAGSGLRIRATPAFPVISNSEMTSLDLRPRSQHRAFIFGDESNVQGVRRNFSGIRRGAERADRRFSGRGPEFVRINRAPFPKGIPGGGSFLERC